MNKESVTQPIAEVSGGGEMKIEKGVPLPPPGSCGRTSKYPFQLMDVGDSFFVPCSNEESACYRRRITAAVQKVFGKLAGHVAIRRVDGGLRVWRLK